MHGEEEVLDLEVARRLIPGGAKGVRSLAALARTECPERMAEAQEAVRRGETKVMFRAVHSLKATFGWFGAQAAADAAGAVEGPARLGDLESAVAALPALETAAGRFVSALGDLEASLASGGDTEWESPS